MFLINFGLGVKAVNYVGIPFTADGIMAFLQSGLDATQTYCFPGIWSTTKHAESTDYNTEQEIPYLYQKQTSGTPGLYDSRYVTDGDVVFKPVHKRTNMGPPNGRSQVSKIQSSISTPQTITNSPQEESRYNLGQLLINIEKDTVYFLIPLLYRQWLAGPKTANDPSGASTIEEVENALWECLKSSFKDVFPCNLPDRETISTRLATRDLTHRWKTWRKWIDSSIDMSSVGAVSPSSKDVEDFVDTWITIWQVLLKFSPEYRLGFGVYDVSIRKWKYCMAKYAVKQL